MYLSKLEIIGFKSFAQKVNLSFDQGMSAIVGPNGCGKTNIVDAIRWVLGEQRYSALRSEKMEDVIFNGTKHRKPLGMAEVSLVIENTKGILPSDYTEVTIGRRVYRSGESEYLLNKIPCRLKDIIDLFMDTGMGADAYSVIELKMIETILSDKTDERRRLFEEAAGVTKYKHRRKAAYRKLESVQADLVRVNDIVSEVHKAVTTLERQARKAEQYNEVHARLRSLEIDLMEREYAHLESRIAPLMERLSALNTDKNRIDTDLSGEEARLDTMHARLADVERQLAEAQQAASAQLDRINRVEQKSLVTEERLRSLRANISRCENEKNELHAEMGQLGVLKLTLLERIGDLENRERVTQEEFVERRENLTALEGQLEEKKAELQSLNERTIALVQEIADRQMVLDRDRGRVENLAGRAAHAHDENAAYEQEIVRIKQDIEDLSAEDKRLRRLFTEAEMSFYEAESRKAELRERTSAVERQEIEVNGEIERRVARIDFLKGLIESREGMPEGVRVLATTGKWTPARKTILADAVRAEERFRAAIESALGDFVNLVIVENARDAEHGIALIKEARAGKATFVCLDRVPRISTRARLPRIDGVLGWARDLVSCDMDYTPLFAFLLDRTMVVDKLETAHKVVRRIPGVRCVTLDGDVVSTTGIVHGGSKRNENGGSIGKRQQIEVLEREIEELRTVLAGLAVTKKELAEADARIDLRSHSEAVKAIEKDMSNVEVRIAQLEFEKKRAGDIIARNTEEIERLRAESAILHAAIADATPAFERLKADKTVVEHRVGAVAQEVALLEDEWNERSRAVNDLEIRLVTLRGELQNARNDVKRAEETIADIITALQRRDADISAAESEVVAASESVEETRRLLDELRNAYEDMERSRASLEDNAGNIRAHIHEIELKIKDERRSHDDSLKAAHELELKLTDLKGKVEHIKARAQEEFDIALTLKAYAEDEFVDFAALRDEIQACRNKIKSLGNINFAAFEEYTTEKERFEFLSAQRQDLLEAEKTLLQTIEEINTTAQNKFMETFNLIRTNFIETFKSLFDPGDECDLVLEEGVDPLEANVDIIAKPRGKRPTSIHLLSGGEKTLTAIALLFAIYLVKPSPFCILDEVDAPLDDANIDRFTRILRKFSDNTQFIVVTHNKRTMESANALYGVTMEEEGVSKIVTVRFNQGAEVKSASLVSG